MSAAVTALSSPSITEAASEGAGVQPRTFGFQFLSDLGHTAQRAMLAL
jgi:hypothetical protein